MQKTSATRWAVRSVSGVVAAGAVLAALALPASATVISVTGSARTPGAALNAAVTNCQGMGGTYTGQVLGNTRLSDGTYRYTVGCDL